MEKLKTFDEITKPDALNEGWVVVDRASGERRPYSLRDMHDSLQMFELTSDVPDDVHDHFQTARHLLLYSWFVYRFIAVAQMQAFASLEYALRLRLDYKSHDRRGLTSLLEEAIARDMFRDKAFRDCPGHDTEGLADGDWFAKKVTSLVRVLRNSLAHGSSTLVPDGGLSLRIVADAINQLFAHDRHSDNRR